MGKSAPSNGKNGVAKDINVYLCTKTCKFDYKNKCVEDMVFFNTFSDKFWLV